MAKLFVVATPLQMLVAQQIIRQEKIKDAILLQSYFHQHPNFVQSYDVCRIDSLWYKQLETVVDFPSWDNQGINLINSAITTWKRFKKIKKTLDTNGVDTIYIADYQNQTYRFMTILFSHLGYYINFYEEGYSHYVPRIFKQNTGVIAKLKEFLLDYCYYLPVYNVKFAKWRNNPNRPYNGLPINKRFSIVPHILEEPYDVGLECEPMISEKLRRIIDDDVDREHASHCVLFLSDPMSEVLYDDYKFLYFKVIKEELLKLSDNITLYVKFHPRENEISIEKHLSVFRSININFRILSSKVNIPVEYYLLNIKFDTILFFNTSTIFYNGFLFPKSCFKGLLPLLLTESIKNNAPRANIKQMQLIIEKIDALNSIDLKI